MKICPTCKVEYGGGEVFCPVDATRLTTPSQMAPPPDPGADPLVGSTVSERYRILRQIGEGGMGIVYEAEHVVIEKRVALKVLRDDFSRKSDVVERFRQEAKSASRIGHEHIVDISDFGETPLGQSYFVMEFLEGEDLANVLEREATVSADRAVNMALQCCQALGAAHAKGIVHRDMKPENIFLVRRPDRQDFVKIVDFGIAKMSDIETPGEPGRKLTKTGMIFGTPEYMSPEQAAGKALDHRVDVYAMGVILYEMITGRVPFIGDSFMGILTQHMFEPVPPIREANPGARISDELDAVIMTALAKEPDERFQTMDEMAQALHTAMGWGATPGTHPGIGDAFGPAAPPPAPAVPTAGRSTPSTPSDLRRGRKGSRVAVVAVASVALLAGLATAGWFVLRPEPTTADASLEPSATEPVAPVAVAEPAPLPEEPPAAAEPEPTSVEPAEPAPIEVTVETRPAGARVQVEGRGQVCDTTPCTFETPPGEPIALEAVRGRARASQEVTPEEATTVELRLRAPRRRGTTRRRTRSTGTQSEPRATGDLKVPDIFR